MLRDFPNPQNGNFTALAFSIDNTYLFLTDDKGYFHVYVCIEEEEEEDTTQSNNNSNEKEEKSESNKDKTAVETKESGTAITTSLKLHTDAILSLKLSRNKAMALVTSLDQSATLLDIRDGKNIRVSFVKTIEHIYVIYIYIFTISYRFCKNLHPIDRYEEV